MADQNLGSLGSRFDFALWDYPSKLQFRGRTNKCESWSSQLREFCRRDPVDVQNSACNCPRVGNSFFGLHEEHFSKSCSSNSRRSYSFFLCREKLFYPSETLMALKSSLV